MCIRDRHPASYAPPGRHVGRRPRWRMELQWLPLKLQELGLQRRHGVRAQPRGGPVSYTHLRAHETSAHL
eukprot:1642594-Alexandrium_andersonii.AAC.1